MATIYQKGLMATFGAHSCKRHLLARSNIYLQQFRLVCKVIQELHKSHVIVQTTNRLTYIDLGAGIMILWMVLYHALQAAWGMQLNGYWDVTDAALLPQGAKAFINTEEKVEIFNPCVLFPYISFFMPWFFYKSGQFFQKRPIKALWKKDSAKLLKTFVLWSAVGYVFYLIFHSLDGTLTLRSATYSILRGFILTGKIPINEPLWFLLTLFIVRAIANRLLPANENKSFHRRCGAIVLIGAGIAYICYLFPHRLLPYWVANTASGLCFFALGYWLSRYETKWWLLAPCIIAYLVCCFAGFPMVDMIFNKLFAGQYELWIPTAFCGIVTFNAFCRGIAYLWKGHKSLLQLAGQNAMIIYVTHIFIRDVLQFVAMNYNIVFMQQYFIYITIAAYAVLIPAICAINNKHHALTA